MSANDARHADQLRITSGEERGPRGRTDGAIGIRVLEAHARGEESVEVRRLHVGGALASKIAIAQVIREDDNEAWWSRVGAFRRLKAQRDQRPKRRQGKSPHHLTHSKG